MKKLISYGLAIGLLVGGFTPSVQAIQDSNNSSVITKISKELWEDSKIMIGSILVAIAYGIGNDQVTARICPEYFTEGFHKNMLQRNAWNGNKRASQMLQVTDPTKIGLYWGVYGYMVVWRITWSSKYISSACRKVAKTWHERPHQAGWSRAC